MTQKPELSLIKGKGVTAEDIAALYEKLTGKKSTEEQIQASRERLRDAQAKRA